MASLGRRSPIPERIAVLVVLVSVVAVACGGGGPVGGGLEESSAAGLEWTLGELSGQTIVDNVVATEDGFIGYLCIHGAGAWRSSDGIAWTEADLTAEIDYDPSMLCSVKLASDQFYAVGGNEGRLELWTSSDGLDWRMSPLDLASPSVSGVGCCEVIPGQDNLLLVGGYRTPAGHRPVMWASTDGTEWELIPDDESFLPSNAQMHNVRHLGGIYLALGHTMGADGGGVLWGSTDGYSWESLPTEELGVSKPDEELAPTQLGGRILTAARTRDGIKLFVSTDGRSWEQLPGSSPITHPSGGDLELFRLEAGAFGFAVLTGSMNSSDSEWDTHFLPTLWLSKDGADWVAINMPEAFGTADEPEHIVVGSDSVVVLWPLGGEGTLRGFGNPPSLMWTGQWS